MKACIGWLAALLVAIGFVASSIADDAPVTVRCAVIGGMTETGFWDALADRFTAVSGHRVEVVATGPKHQIAPALVAGECDLITMHACDTIINLVADGYGEDPQPWLKNDLLLVGPPADPAGVRGMKDAVAALGKIVDSQSTLLIHSSLGAQEVLNDLLAADGIEIDPAHTITLPGDRQRQLLKRAAEEQAYTLVGRIPFKSGKIPGAELEIMVEGDARMRRPYLVVVARAERTTPERHAAAQQLVRFLRAAETQAWIADYGRGQLDEGPLFFPIEPVASER